MRGWLAGALVKGLRPSPFMIQPRGITWNLAFGSEWSPAASTKASVPATEPKTEDQSDRTCCFKPNDRNIQAFDADGNVGPFPMSEQLLGVGTGFADEGGPFVTPLFGQYLVLNVVLA